MSKQFEFWADGKQFFTSTRSMSMSQLAYFVGAPRSYNCLQEIPPNLVPIENAQSVDLTQCPRFFFPNANY
jgi:hypothetical protein